ncbi:MAG: hypothetical protein ABSE73_09900 [Planctomycetota bacterium]
MRKYQSVLVLAVAFSFVITVLPAPAAAKKQFLKSIAGHLDLSEELAKCSICHTGKDTEADADHLNVFGKDFRKALKEAPAKAKDARPLIAFEAVKDLDSDHDGVTNLEEIMLGSNPGDPNSKPDPEKLAEYRRNHPK